ncbi:MAG: hypothetical protein IJ741_04960 [Schwartzia sp.]|nr:hypothetical protein [Schwartzia sp. (in: firmicutes)]
MSTMKNNDHKNRRFALSYGKHIRHWIGGCLAAALLTSALPVEAALPDRMASEESLASETANPSDSRAAIGASIYLDYAAGIRSGVYRWILSEDETYYVLAAVDESGIPIVGQETRINVGANNEEQGHFPADGHPDGPPPDFAGKPDGMPPGGFDGGTVYQGVAMNAHVTNLANQTMLIYVPAAYLQTNANGEVVGIDHAAAVGQYTADTAPIVYLNECGGWKSSSPRAVDASFIERGMIYVTAGARSRDAVDENGCHTGKAPMPVVDLKSGVIALRANADVIPGDKERIVSVGTSGGGQMSSILGASGDMPEYYPYLYEAGAAGVTKTKDGYRSAYPDHIFAAQMYCPIADIENADLAYAWWWFDLADRGGALKGTMTAFDRRLQELEAQSFVDYLNGLNVKDMNGAPLKLDGLRSGSYYDAILRNLSDALNAMVATGGIDADTLDPEGTWLTKNADGSYHVTDMAGFMTGTGLAQKRNKAIPGFDAMDKSAENDAFGAPDDNKVHFSRSVAKILFEHYDELSTLDGFDATLADAYITEALTGPGADAIARQTHLLNATHILLGTDGLCTVHPAKYWRHRSGTADQHTSFGVGYNLCRAAASIGLDADYHLVWAMEHGNREGTSTGTFIDWIDTICR